MIIDYKGHRILLEDGRVIYLTLMETRLLELIYENKGNVVSYKEIAKEIYETEIDVCLKNTITINISRLKKKIGKYIEIKTIRQAGYIVEKSYKR